MTTGKTVYTLAEIVAHARRHSPFYRECYRHIPEGESALDQLPLLEQTAFWAANDLANNQLLTDKLADGFVFKSGGTTGAPKFSVYTKEEWAAFTGAFGRGMAAKALKAGDRIANLFYVGDLYASFLFIMASIERAPLPLLQLPIGGVTSPAAVRKAAQDFQANVLAGVPTTLAGFAEFLVQQGVVLNGVERVIFGGEAFYDDQRPLFATVFPRAEIVSIGYASVDAGLLGYADDTCSDGEHRPFNPETIVEIVDETSGEPINAAGLPGKVVVTSLTRRLMPIIRYPAGDRAVWLDPEATGNRRFKLLGRSEEGARIGPVTVYLDDVRQILRQISPDGRVLGFQLVVRRETGRDLLEVRLVNASAGKTASSLEAAFRERFYAARPMYKQLLDEGKIAAARLVLVTAQDLAINPRTGKQLLLLDLRKMS